jgi:archaellum component FlaF (FlaF/FlaG flagellin family)
LAYHIVREADLLTAYDIDRCIIYSMMVKNLPYIESVERAVELIHKRVLQYKNNDLFITKYSIEESTILHDKCLREIEHINTVIETIKHKT